MSEAIRTVSGQGAETTPSISRTNHDRNNHARTGAEGELLSNSGLNGDGDVRACAGLREAGSDAGRNSCDLQIEAGAVGQATGSNGCDPLGVLNSLSGQQIERLALADCVGQYDKTPIRHVPRVVVSSPAYQMPEIPSDAQVFADDYRKKHALGYWLVDHLANAYMFGKRDGFVEASEIAKECIKASLGGGK